MSDKYLSFNHRKPNKKSKEEKYKPLPLSSEKISSILYCGNCEKEESLCRCGNLGRTFYTINDFILIKGYKPSSL